MGLAGIQHVHSRFPPPSILLTTPQQFPHGAFQPRNTLKRQSVSSQTRPHNQYLSRKTLYSGNQDFSDLEALSGNGVKADTSTPDPFATGASPSKRVKLDPGVSSQSSPTSADDLDLPTIADYKVIYYAQTERQNDAQRNEKRSIYSVGSGTKDNLSQHGSMGNKSHRKVENTMDSKKSLKPRQRRRGNHIHKSELSSSPASPDPLQSPTNTGSRPFISIESPPPVRYQGTAMIGGSATDSRRLSSLSLGKQSNKGRQPKQFRDHAILNTSALSRKQPITTNRNSQSGSESQTQSEHFASHENHSNDKDSNEQDGSADELDSGNTIGTLTVDNDRSPSKLFQPSNPPEVVDKSTEFGVSKQLGIGIPASNIPSTQFSSNNRKMQQVKDQPNATACRNDNEVSWEKEICSIATGQKQVKGPGLMLLNYDSSPSFDVKFKIKYPSQKNPGISIQPAKILKIIQGGSGSKLRIELSKSEGLTDQKVDIEMYKEEDTQVIIDKLRETQKTITVSQQPR